MPTLEERIANLETAISTTKKASTLKNIPSNSTGRDHLVLNPATGEIEKIPNFSEKLIGSVSSGYKGSVIISDTPTEDGVYTPIEEGAYPNSGGLIYAPSTTDASKDVKFIKNGSSWVKSSVDLGIEKAVDGEILEDNTKYFNGRQLSVFFDKKADLAASKNLFNKLLATDDFLKTETGAITSASGVYYYSDLISNVAGKTLIANARLRFTTYYNASGDVVTGGSNSTTPSGTVINIPSNVYFFSFTGFLEDKDTTQIEKSAVVTYYEDYNEKIPESQLPTFQNLIAGDISINNISSSVTGNKIFTALENKSNLIPSVNLFNKDDAAVVEGSYINNSGTIVPSSGLYYSHPIYNVAGETLVWSKNIRYTVYYDVNGNVISGGSSTQINAGTAVTIPNNIHSLIFSAFTASILTQQLQIGSTVLDYKSFGAKIPASEIPEIEATYNPFSFLDGAKITYYGDSNTASNMFQQFIESKLPASATHYNRGIGGTTMTEKGSIAWVNSDGDYLGRPDNGDTEPSGTEGIDYFEIESSGCNQDRIDTIPLDTTHLLAMFGTNDKHQNMPLGTTWDSADTTFFGAYRAFFTRLYARLPNVTVIVATHIHSKQDFTDNTLGLVNEDYREITRAAANKYKYIIAEQNENGINAINEDDYLLDVFHFNTAGAEKVSVPFLNALKKLN